ncbi:MAG: CoA transferase [Desulfitobacteriaceae bacterium]
MNYFKSSCLEGITVIDMSRMLAGPYCAKMLADMGARVIKVEPLEGEDSRRMGVLSELAGESFLYLCANTGKEDIAIELNTKGGREILQQLINQADVLIENFLPRSKKSLDLIPDKCLELNPRLVYCSLTSFGQTGPWADNPGVDVIFQAASGMMSITGEPEGEPMKAGVPVADMSAAFQAVAGILAALYEREKTGKGKVVEVSLLDAILSVQASMITMYFATGKELTRLGTGSPVLVPSQMFQTIDGYIVVSIFNERSWQQLCQILGRTDLAQDFCYDSNEKRVAHREKLVADLAQDFFKFKTAEIIEVLEQNRIPVSKVLSYDEVFSSPQVRQNAITKTWVHPVAGQVTTLGNTIKLRNAGEQQTNSNVSPVAAPLLGQHTHEILAEFGYSPLEINTLIEQKVIA